jgi:hypothetical protein
MDIKFNMHNTENKRTVSGEATNLDMVGLEQVLSLLYRFATERTYTSFKPSLPDMECGLIQHTPDVEIITPLPTKEIAEVIEPEAESGSKRISHDELRDKGLLTGPSLAARFPKEYEAAIVEARELMGAGAAMHTGIKFDEDGVPLFQTRYVCGSCGNRGKRFTFNKSQYCKCHNCPTRMRIEYASNKNLRDQYGNYYKAIKEHGE